MKRVLALAWAVFFELKLALNVALVFRGRVVFAIALGALQRNFLYNFTFRLGHPDTP